MSYLTVKSLFYFCILILFLNADVLGISSFYYRSDG